MSHCMIDLETLGTSAGCVVLSLGAITFDMKGVHKEDSMYTVIDRDLSVAEGFFIDPKTEDWWNKQDENVRKELFEYPDKVSPDQACVEFYAFCQAHNVKYIWSNGADFDIPILHAYFDKCSRRWPIKYWNDRCYRTLKNLCPSVEGIENNEKHNALSDAVYQAQIAAKCLEWLEKARRG